jgi:hypothetical protein
LINRILFAWVIAAFLVWQPKPSLFAQDKGSSAWKSVEDFKVLKLWEEPNLGPKEPQVAILQLSAERQKELQCDPLAFYKKYKIFYPKVSDLSKGQFVIQLGDSKPSPGDPYIVVVTHDSHTYSAFAAFSVDGIN